MFVIVCGWSVATPASVTGSVTLTTYPCPVQNQFNGDFENRLLLAAAAAAAATTIKITATVTWQTSKDLQHVPLSHEQV